MGKACLPIARMPGTAVALQIFQVAHIACEEALAERGEGDEADRQIARVRAHHLRFLAGKQEVFRLNGAHRMHRVGAADAFQVPSGGARSRKPALLHECHLHADRAFLRDIRIDTMLKVKPMISIQTHFGLVLHADCT